MRTIRALLGMAGLTCLMVCAAGDSVAQRRSGFSTHEALRQFARDELRDNGDTPARDARFVYALVDLNGDKVREAIVRIIDRSICGSGGCNLYILARRGRGYRIVSSSTISRPPIRVLPTRSHGWRNISVWVGGGGISPGYEAELAFNGSRYPLNPTVPPARRLRDPDRGRIVISRAAREYRVY